MEMKDDPVKGVVYYLIHSVLLSINLYTNKALFGLNPAVSVLQFTFARGLCSVLLSLLMSRGNLRHELVDCVDRSSLPSLVFRCLQGALSVFISFMCMKYFDVSTVGIVCSLTPLFVCLLAYFMLGERLKRSDQMALVFVVACVCLVMLGADPTTSSTGSMTGTLPMIALLSQPFLLAAGMIAMRQMRKLPETCCSTYCNLTIFLVSAVAMLIS